MVWEMDASKREIVNRANFLIFDFLKNQLQQKKSAEDFKKLIQSTEYNDIIVFKGIPDLLEILKLHFKSCSGTTADDVSSEQPVKKKNKRKSESQQQQPETATAAEDAEAAAQPAAAVNGDEVENKITKKKKKKDRKTKLPDAEQQEQQQQQPEAVETAPSVEAAETAPSVEAPANGESAKKLKKRKKKELQEQQQQLPSADEVQEEHGPAAKRQRSDSDSGAGDSNNQQQKRKHGTPYRRVREEEIDNRHFQDNSFDAKRGSRGSWGYKANEDLKPTQGRSFRHEKTKKKRGSYKGGAIDTGVSSVKFDSDDE